LQIPVDQRVKELIDLPYTISYCIRKRSQIDNLSELPKAKRPPDKILWDGTGDELEEWLDKVIDSKQTKSEMIIRDTDIE
jgi:hypothetical protein